MRQVPGVSDDEPGRCVLAGPELVDDRGTCLGDHAHTVSGGRELLSEPEHVGLDAANRRHECRSDQGDRVRPFQRRIASRGPAVMGGMGTPNGAW